jgi:hypothetical protein
MEGRAEHRKASAYGNGLMQLGYFIVGKTACVESAQPRARVVHRQFIFVPLAA